MLFNDQELQELQYAPLMSDAASQAYWMRQFSSQVLQLLPGSSGDPFGGQLVTEEMLGEGEAATHSWVKMPKRCKKKMQEGYHHR